jgi:peptidoglycan hydrolase-like protein with peptidoglycan-binding domain
MMKQVKMLVAAAALVAVASGSAMATPTGTFWTPMSMDIQSYKVVHLGIDNYFTIDKKASSGEQGAFPTDLGLTLGVLPFEKIQMEVGIDANYPTDNPYSFNAKIGAPEDVLFKYSPALQVGIYGVGTKSKVTDYNIIYGVIGKSIPGVGRLSAGPYMGNKDLLINKANGEKENSGFMVAFDHAFIPAKDAAGNEYNKVVFAADYASGKNDIGGYGFGVNYYFTKDISLLTGPVFFNEKSNNPAWKLSTQLDINLPSF